MKTIYDVVDQALKDPLYAADIAGKAARASRAGQSREDFAGDEWSALLAEFADGPEDLARLTTPPDEGPRAGTTWTITTTSTITTTTTVVCTTTSTTTVTGTITVTLTE